MFDWSIIDFFPFKIPTTCSICKMSSVSKEQEQIDKENSKVKKNYFSKFNLIKERKNEKKFITNFI